MGHAHAGLLALGRKVARVTALAGFHRSVLDRRVVVRVVADLHGPLLAFVGIETTSVGGLAIGVEHSIAHALGRVAERLLRACGADLNLAIQCLRVNTLWSIQDGAAWVEVLKVARLLVERCLDLGTCPYVSRT